MSPKAKQSVHFLVCRHAESEGVQTGTVEDKLGKLTPHGENEAAQLAYALRKHNIIAAYCGEFERQKETAREILTYHPNVTLRINSAFNELAMGILYGKQKTVMRKLRDQSGDFARWAPEGGESLAQGQERITRGFLEIYDLYSQPNNESVHQKPLHREGQEYVLIVTSAAVKRGLLLSLKNLPYTLKNSNSHHPEPTALSHIHKNGKGWIIDPQNDISHLNSGLEEQISSFERIHYW